jgi:hypothetical protein
MVDRKDGSGGWSRRNFAPAVLLNINGKDASDLLGQLTTFTHKRELAKSAESKFTFRNDTRRLLDDPRTFPNTTWTFRYGYLNDMSPIITGIVREVEPSYADRRTVVITLYDMALNMSQTSAGKNWGKVSTSEIARQLAKLHGFQATIEESGDVPKKAWVQPGDVNDIRYLRDLAMLIDFEVLVEGTPPRLVYRKKQYDSPPVGTFIYHDDPSERLYVNSFKPKVKSLGPYKSSASGANDQKKDDKKKNVETGVPKKVVQLSARPNLGPRGVVNGNSFEAKVINNPAAARSVNRPVPSNANARKTLEAARSQMLDRANEASSAHPLTPSIQLGELYTWKGIEKQVDGKWYTKEINDTISGSGAATTVSWKRNSTGAGKPADNGNKNNKEDGGPKTGDNAFRMQIEAATGKLTVIPPKAKPPAPRPLPQKTK